ncbi:hypothetical protein GGI12_005506, partial [Dipsacomyces acuminosporus]
MAGSNAPEALLAATTPAVSVAGVGRVVSSRYRLLLLLLGGLALFYYFVAVSPPPATQQLAAAKADGHAGSPSACKRMPIPGEYWRKKPYTQPFAEIQTTGDRVVRSGEAVCVRVVVPPHAYNSTMLFMPFANTPWDSVLLDVVGRQTGISIPVQLRPSDNFENYNRDYTHVYEADVRLLDADLYTLRGFVEFRDARWNPEVPVFPVPYKPEQVRIDAEKSWVRVAGGAGLDKYVELPLCKTPSAEGRWVRARDLPFSASLVPPPDNHGRVWVAHGCRYRRFSYEAFAQCLVSKYPVVHWFGDSNSRRALKKITSLGQWCSKPEDVFTRTCICEDLQEDFERFNHNTKDTVIHMDATVGGLGGVSGDEFYMHNIGHHEGDRAQIYFHKWEGLTVLNKPTWNVTFEDRLVERFGSPRLVVVSLTNWDAAFSTLVSFAKQVDSLLGYMQR